MVDKATTISGGSGVVTALGTNDTGAVSAAYAIGSDTKIYYVSTYNKADTVEIASPSSLATLTANGEYKVVMVLKSSDDKTLREVWVMTNGTGTAKGW